jgi:hypothetical protein
LLGAAGEALGYDRHLKSNTTKRRTHSLFRQGAMLYDRKRPPMTAYQRDPAYGMVLCVSWPRLMSATA